MTEWFAALSACFVATLCFYLAAPKQQLLARAWPGRPARIAGLLLLLIGWLLLSRHLHQATAFFVVLAVVMVVSGALPWLVLLWSKVGLRTEAR